MDIISTTNMTQLGEIISGLSVGYNSGSTLRIVGSMAGTLAYIGVTSAISISLLNHLGYVTVNKDVVVKDFAPLINLSSNVNNRGIVNTVTTFLKDHYIFTTAVVFGLIVSK
jgi:uncharacterized membrane protein (Fun14 family)